MSLLATTAELKFVGRVRHAVAVSLLAFTRGEVEIKRRSLTFIDFIDKEQKAFKELSFYRRQKKSKLRTYSIKNHIYFKIDDPLCWPCQLLVFQDVGFLFTILNLWEERHDSRLSHGLCRIHSPGHLWPPAAETDKESKTTVAILTSTCSLPAPSLSGEINYRGIQHGRGPRVLNSIHYIYIFFFLSAFQCMCVRFFNISVENWLTFGRNFHFFFCWRETLRCMAGEWDLQTARG